VLREVYAIDGLPLDDPAWEDIKQAAFADGVEMRDPAGNSMMMVALWSGKRAAAFALHALGSDPSLRNDKGLTVFQSIIRDLHKGRHTLPDLAATLRKMPHAWTKPQSVQTEEEFLDFLTGWVSPFLSLSHSRLDKHAQGDLEVVLDYITAPLDYDMLNKLDRRCWADADSVSSCATWRACLASKAAAALAALAKECRPSSSEPATRPVF
jgi:hypothetical protein